MLGQNLPVELNHTTVGFPGPPNKALKRTVPLACDLLAASSKSVPIVSKWGSRIKGVYVRKSHANPWRPRGGPAA